MACETLKEDLLHVIRELKSDIPAVFIESTHHNDPASLHRRLAGEIAKASDVDTILLGYGFCGNAACGLGSADKTIVLPQVDDCITLLLGSLKKRKELNTLKPYFLTRGILNNRENIWVEYSRSIDKYGWEKGIQLMKGTLVHYKKIIVIETPSNKPGNWQAKVDELSENLSLEKMTIRGTYALIRQLLTGVWEDNFIVLPPGERIKMEMLFNPFTTGCNGCSRNINRTD